MVDAQLESDTAVPTAAATHVKITTRSYARPLDEDYAKPWLKQHLAKAEQAALVDASRKVQTQAHNTVTVVYWKVVRY